MPTIIGIDPGFATTGYGVIRGSSSHIQYMAHGVIRTKPADGPPPIRLKDIFMQISAVIELYKPDAIAIERLFFARNTTSALQVSEARGVIILAAQLHDLTVYEYTPNQVKMAITGSGAADKKQIQIMIKRILQLAEIPRPDDAADGLSIALCHLNTRRGRQ